MCVHTRVCVSVSVWALLQKSMSAVFFTCLELTGWLHWLTRKPHGPSRVHRPSRGIQTTHSVTFFFLMWMLMSHIQIFMFAWWVPFLTEPGPCGEVILLQCVIRHQCETNEGGSIVRVTVIWLGVTWCLICPVTNSPLYWGDNLSVMQFTWPC